MTVMPSFIPPGFPTQMPVAPVGTPFQMGQPVLPQLSSSVPGVTAAPVLGVSPGGYPLPSMPGLPLPGGVPLQMGPALNPAAQFSMPIPAAAGLKPGAFGTPPGGFSAPPGAYGAPSGAFGAPPGAYPAPPGAFGAPAGAYGAPPAPAQLDARPGAFGTPPPQAFPGAFPGAFPAPGANPQQLAMAILQQPAFQNTLGSWANAWMASPEFKGRLADILGSQDLQAALQKGTRDLIRDKAFLEEVAKRLSQPGPSVDPQPE